MRQTRLYALYEKQGKRYTRRSRYAFRKDEAVRRFQGALLSNFKYCLRPTDTYEDMPVVSVMKAG